MCVHVGYVSTITSSVLVCDYTVHRDARGFYYVHMRAPHSRLSRLEAPDPDVDLRSAYSTSQRNSNSPACVCHLTPAVRCASPMFVGHNQPIYSRSQRGKRERNKPGRSVRVHEHVNVGTAHNHQSKILERPTDRPNRTDRIEIARTVSLAECTQRTHASHRIANYTFGAAARSHAQKA